MTLAEMMTSISLAKELLQIHLPTASNNNPFFLCEPSFQNCSTRNSLVSGLD